jgi:hypothetical protein
MKQIEAVSALLLIALVIGFMGYSGWRLYDYFYGNQLDVPVQGEPTPPRPSTYRVLPGDTIWSIYSKFYQGCNWDEVRYKIGKMNGLKNDTLYPYEVIKLPEVG